MHKTVVHNHSLLGLIQVPTARIQSGDSGSGHPQLENHKEIGFLSKTGPNPLENHKATKPPSQYSMYGHYRPASEPPFLWYLDPLVPHQLNINKRCQS